MLPRYSPQAHDGGLGRQRGKIYQGRRKSESSLAIQLQFEMILFAAFLHVRRVPHMSFPAY